MGRPYKNELNEIENTFKRYMDCDDKLLCEYMLKNMEIPLIVVGSGGSHSVAIAYTLYYESKGGIAKAITPYELPENHKIIPNAKVLILTAGGRNKDTVGAYEYARLYEPKMLMVFCIRKNSIIEKKIRENKDALFFRPEININKDGFLSVNSSIAMLTVLWSIDKYDNNRQEKWNPPTFKDQRSLFSALKERKSIETLLILHGMWGKPAAYDLESKCSEAGLYNVQVVDFRNFAHGRHNWIDKKGETTVVLALSTDEDISIARRTLKRLPDGIDIIDIRARESGIVAVIDFMVQMMYLVDILGDIRGIDPGRPQVPQYGKELYGLKADYIKMDKDVTSLLKRKMDCAIFRAIGSKMDNHFLYKYYVEKYLSFIDELNNSFFRGVVFDYDRTIFDRRFGQISSEAIAHIIKMLSSGICVGFITSGDASIISEIKTMIPYEEHWKRIYIGYYNGTRTGWLSDIHEERITERKSTNLDKFYSLVKENELFSDIQISPNQVTLELDDVNYGFEYCAGLIAKYNIKNLEVFKNTFTVNVINKRNDREAYLMEFNDINNNQVLCIGGSGKIEDANYKLYFKNIALSVDSTDIIAKSGWNIAPLGCRGICAAEYYISCIVINNCGFKIELD